MSAPHRIGLLTLDLELRGSEALGLRVQRELSTLCDTMLPRELAAALAPYDGLEGHLIIERLEVDVGALTWAEIQRDLPASIAAGMSRALDRLGPLAQGDVEAPNAAGSWRRLTARRALLEAFVHTLQWGRLPWWWARGDKSFAAEVEAALGHGSLNVEEATVIAVALESSDRARRRLVAAHSGELVLAVLYGLAAPLAERALAALATLAALGLADAATARMRDHVLHAALDNWTRAGSQAAVALTATQLLRAALAALREEQGEIASAPLAEALGLPPLSMPEQPDLDLCEAEDEEAHAGLIVVNAGVVLLHPFLTHFFEALGLAAGGTLRDPDRAALLLHHLATGAQEAEEVDLVLAKVLCGIPLGAVLRRQPPVTAAEAEESRALLSAALGHWGALGSTTPDGLRGNFLTRRGKLQVGDALTLRLEWQSFDVLLERLPWGLGLIKLPWLPQVLHVEWSP